MGASDSDLSSADYGYDYVVAVSQESINATALAFLATAQPTVEVCYVYGDDGDPKQIDHQALVARAKGTDPFRMPAEGPAHDQAVANLDEAEFMFGFSAAMGLPAGFPVSGLPDILTLGASATDPVVYRLLCKTFTLVDLEQIPHRKPIWKSWSQPTGPGGAPWLFTYDVHLLAKTVEDTRAFVGTPAFGNLPAGVQARVSAAPEDFTIKHLLFDFAHAAAGDKPQIDGVDRVLREKLEEDFSIAYFAQLQDVAMPVVAVLPAGSDPFAGLQTEFSISPAPVADGHADPGAATLNYLCAAAGNPLPAPKPFTWSWLDAEQLQDVDGVCVLNRTHLVKHLEDQLAGYVQSNKWLPQPVLVEVHFASYDAGFGVVGRDYDWGSHGKPDNLAITEETLDKPDTGEVLLHWKFQATRLYTWLRGSSWNQGDTSFELTVRCHGNVVTVEQHAYINDDLTIISGEYGAKLLDVTVVDTITLAVAHDGTLATSQQSHRDDRSDTVGSHWLIPDWQGRLIAIQDRVKQRVAQTLVDVPLRLTDQVVFPGGKGFLFKDVFFSDHQDLVAHITYADPS